MKNKYVAEVTKVMNAPASEVWDALTNPEKIKKYFFGTEAVSDWKEGSTLEFKGVWEGKEYSDKGKILKFEKGKLFQYDYFSSMSGLEDKPENYAVVTFELQPENGKTKLKITQDNIATEDSKKHSEENWSYILNSLKELVEKT